MIPWVKDTRATLRRKALAIHTYTKQKNMSTLPDGRKIDKIKSTHVKKNDYFPMSSLVNKNGCTLPY